MFGIGKVKPEITPGIQECESIFEDLMKMEHMLGRKQIPEESQFTAISDRATKCIEILANEKTQYTEKLNGLSKKTSKPAKVIAATIGEIDKQLRYANNVFKNLEHVRERAGQVDKHNKCIFDQRHEDSTGNVIREYNNVTDDITYGTASYLDGNFNITQEWIDDVRACAEQCEVHLQSAITEAEINLEKAKASKDAKAVSTIKEDLDFYKQCLTELKKEMKSLRETEGLFHYKRDHGMV